ncbi:hypothetical protein RND81_08G167500 [Saponaria officinalis]|uniref:MI domain-containing protein n=1 Tax=Saponaria officinalis TaxID=3572 RepID=A0AAW1J8N9_SAPOF
MEQAASRKEKRKSARQQKKQLKHQSSLHHQKFRKQKKNDISRLSIQRDRKIEGLTSLKESDSERDAAPHESTMVKSGVSHSSEVRNLSTTSVNKNEFSILESDSEGNDPFPLSAVGKKKLRKDNKNSSRKKTKFDEYIEMETKGASMEEDLEMERRLAKKLKVKNGKLKDDDDGLNFLFEGVSSVLDSSEQEYNENVGSKKMDVESTVSKKSKDKKKKKKKNKSIKLVLESDSGCEAFQNEQVEEGVFESGEEGEGRLDSESEEVEDAKIRESKGNMKNQDLKSFDNDCGDTQVASACKYLPPHLRSRSDDLQEYSHIRRQIRGLLNRMSESNLESVTGEIYSIFKSVPRAYASQIVSEEVLGSCSGGPRGNEQYASVFAAFVAGMASMVGIDFGANFLASLAKCFEDEYSKEDNLSLRNLSLFLSYLCIYGVCSSDLIYSFLIKLSKRLTEVDVLTILSVLNSCGMKLRGDDPAAMKDFILSVQARVNELKAGCGDVEAAIYGKRMEFMLETICDIKNNKKRAKEDSPQHTRIKKWLQKLKVENITVSGVDWNKLLDPEKKGQWWHSGDVSSATEEIGKVAGKMDRDVHEAQKMLKLAAKQRMNTDTRRAIFCVIMSAEDYIDAFEQLLSLNLQGKQDREIMRVLLECCLQEKVFNKYYTALALKLCSHDKNHKFSLQYCLWDQFRELESMSLLRSMHLAKFVADMLAGFSLSLAVLKVVDLVDVTHLTSKRIMHFRMLFEAIFEHPNNIVWNMFTRVAVTPELEDLRNGMEFFIREYVVKVNKDFGVKFKHAKKALNNVQGILM